MTHVDKELEQLKLEISNMWELVIQQLEKTRSALISFDRGLAQEVVNEIRVPRDVAEQAKCALDRMLALK